MSSYIQRHRPKLVIGGVAGCLAVGVLLVTPLLKFDHELSTPGTRNIQDRFSAGGAAKTHTPALGTKRGDSEDVLPRGKAGLDRGGKEWNEKVEQQAPRT